jgi:catechol-2,3-dioxygenase
MSGLGIRRLQHLVLWVADVERSERFYRDVLGFEVAHRYPQAAFMRIPGSGDDHNLGLFEQPGLRPPDESDLARARRALIEAGSLVGQSDHGVSLSLYAKDPDGLEFELFWTVPDGKPVRTRPLDLEREMTRRGVVV